MHKPAHGGLLGEGSKPYRKNEIKNFRDIRYARVLSHSVILLLHVPGIVT